MFPHSAEYCTFSFGSILSARPDWSEVQITRGTPLRQTGYFRPYIFKGEKSPLEGSETLHVPYVQVWYGGVVQIENKAGKGWPVRVSAESGP